MNTGLKEGLGQSDNEVLIRLVAKCNNYVLGFYSMGFRTYLFDLDGTLVDHFQAIHRSYVFTMNRLGLPKPTMEQVRSAVGGGLERAFSKLIPTQYHQEGLTIYREYWDKTMLDDVVLLPGALSLLEKLHARGATLGVCTNKHGPSARRICEHLSIARYMNVVVGAGDTPWLKPAAQMTSHTLNLLGSSTKAAVLIGDSPFDVQAAHNGGIVSWCVTTGTHNLAELKEAGADAIYANFDEMADDLGL